MGKPKYANPRDANEQALLDLAARLGGHWCEAPPLDGWCFVRGRWMPVEFKVPEREGLQHEYTPAQRRFFAWCTLRAAPWWVWRTDADVIRDLGARVAA
jgi:hypothetical protein